MYTSFLNYVRNNLSTILKIFFISTFLAVVVTNFVIINLFVPTSSMEITIKKNDRLLANRLSYSLKTPKRFDIVVFRYPDNEDTIYVKRIIGLPNEKIEIKYGLVYIDGSKLPLDDSFVKNKNFNDFGPYTVPSNSYFMLGDNRNSSNDSRYWEKKFVSSNKILGKVVLRMYPNFKIFA